MANPSQLVRYFRDCYEADNRETGIANLLSKKYQHVFFPSDTDDLLRGLLDRVPTGREKAVAARKEAELYKKDKALIFGAFPLVGKVPKTGRLPEKLCAPLVFFPATIELEDDKTFLSVDLTQQRVNVPVLAALLGEEEDTQSLVTDLLGQIPHAPFSRDDIHSLISLLMDFLPGVEALGLAEYPKLLSAKEVRRAMTPPGAEDQNRLQCLPACAVALVPNSPSTRGALFELTEMADGRPLSTPVGLLLEQRSENPEPTEREAAATGRVPAVLSHAQQAVLTSAFSAPLTLVVGPPGTGKSYTIAALALDHLSRGQSVLIASRMNHAVDVVARKIEEMIGPTPCVIRGGRKQYSRDLKEFLRQILHGMRLARPVDEHKVRRMEAELAGCDRSLETLARKLRDQGDWEKHWGLQTAGPKPGGWLASSWQSLKLRLRGWQMSASSPLWELAWRYELALRQRSWRVTWLLQTVVARRLQSMLKHHRRDLSKFNQAIRSRTDLKQERLFSEISREVLFGTFPIWLVTLADVSEVLPLESEMFDLVILDEATQCDMASCLPVLQRARRAVVVGDPNQLRHVSFLSGQRQRVIAERNELDRAQQDLFPYRRKSILDLLSDTISTQQQVLFLDEHFRSMPQIIAFSNREFYAGALKVMTQRPETAELQCVRLCHVSDGRKDRGANENEAKALVEEVADRVRAEEFGEADVCHSLGILSPFRDQVDHISSLLQERLPLEAMRKHDLMVGTAHTFQGEERDVMYLSLVVDRQAHSASFRFLNNPNIFNVAITRARNEQYVFCSIGPEDVAGDTLLGRYLASIADGPRPSSAARGGVSDMFLREVRGELEERGFHAWPAYPVAGMEIDLVIERSGQTLGIDLIGHPGQFAAVFDLERYRMFQRAGLVLFPLSYWAWQRDKAACVDAIARWHKRLLG